MCHTFISTNKEADEYILGIIVKTPDTAKKNLDNRLKYATWETGALNGKRLDFD